MPFFPPLWKSLSISEFPVASPIYPPPFCVCVCVCVCVCLLCVLFCLFFPMCLYFISPLSLRMSVYTRECILSLISPTTDSSLSSEFLETSG